jgi:hypothetical protein
MFFNLKNNNKKTFNKNFLFCLAKATLTNLNVFLAFFARKDIKFVCF